MSARPTITWPDLRMLFEQKIQQDTLYEWVEDKGIDPEAMEKFSEMASATLWESMTEIDDLTVEEFTAGTTMLAMACFQLGWDAHYQMRGERE